MHEYHWLEELHTTHYATLVRLATNRLLHLTGSAAEAEDVVQEAFMLAIKKKIRQSEHPLRWLMKTTSNLCLQRMDRVKADADREQRFIERKKLVTGDTSVYAVERTESETGLLLWLILLEQTLSPQEWEIMRKYCIEGVPIETLAAELGIPVSRLKVKIHRIRKKYDKISQDL